MPKSRAPTPPEPPLHRLIYYSRNRLEPGTEQAQIAEILMTSRRNNVVAAITGALLFNTGVFAQVLEGPQTDIERTFERIQRDERHGEVQVLGFAPIANRSFANWAMGFVGRSKVHQQLFANIGSQTGFTTRPFASDRVLQLIAELALEEEEWSDPGST